MQPRGGDSPPLPPSGAQGAPRGCAFLGSREACAGRGAPAGPAASASIGAQPQILHRAVGGGASRKRSHPSPDKIQVMGGGRRKSFSAKSTEPTGLHPASTVRCRHKAAPPPPPAPPPPLPPPTPYGRPGAGAGPARGWRRWGGGGGPGGAAPPRPGREGESLEAARARLPGWGLGRGPGWGGAFLETLAKYSQRIGAFLEMRRRRQPRPVGAEPGVLQTGGGGGGGRDSPFPTPRGPEEEAWAGPPSWGRAGVLHMRSRDPSAGVQGA